MARLIPRKPPPDVSLVFRRHLAMQLNSVKRVTSKRDSPLSGLIRHPGGESEIVISRFNNPLKVPPSINCSERWVRRNSDWHYEDHNNRFCWVLQDEWEEHFERRKSTGENLSTLCRDAGAWAIKAMEYVLMRHWTGYEFGIVDWPQDWESFSHGDEGVIEYRTGRFH